MSKGCVFCSIAQGKDETTTILYEDEELIVFPDIKPASQHHYLVCPKEHIRDAKHLTNSHLSLVEKMIVVGKEVLEKQGADTTKSRFGFHWPPFQLVSHVHLHVISPETEMGFISRQIFRPNSWWFVSTDWLLDRLKNLPKSEM